MELTNSKLSNYILFSNKNVEKLCRSLINESANAVLLETYSDKLLMADHNSGAIYTADYSFDGRSLVIENYEVVDVIKDNSKLNEAIGDYFDDNGDISDIVEAYEEDSEAANTDLSESITEALSSKNFKDNVNYTQLLGINEEIGDLKDMDFFKKYTEYLTEAPTSSIKVFDWEHPVRVVLEDFDQNRTVISGAKDKAQLLSKNKDFRAAFAEAAEDMMNEDTSSMVDLISENASILSLDPAEFKEFVGLSVIGNKFLMENRKEVISRFDSLIDEDEMLSETKMMLNEEDDEEAAEEDKELETTDKDKDALLKALDKALENITDEKLVSKINSLKDALDASKDEGTTDVGTVKECVELLNL